MKPTKQEDHNNCVVCGARRRFLSDTCDPVCGRAKNTGRSRAGQISAEIHASDRADRALALASRYYNHVARRVTQESLEGWAAA